ncbi:MAG: divergent polysaccharide deacetylase family protein [Caulobacteraceae bacterium]|nr:divergent polysaccharide deacetylase family protein [Caulobacter sp.]
MFARPAAAAPFRAAAPAPASSRTPDAAPSWRASLERIRERPLLALGGGVGALGLAAALLVAAFGDPHAGAPHLRARLHQAGPLSEAALRGETTPAPGDPAADPLAAQAAPGAGAEAVITLPDGGRVTGAPDATTAAAAPARPLGPPLPPAPIAGLTAPGPGGLLPIIAKDGRTPFQAYARPFTPNGKPRIALVVGGLGLNATATRAAISRLPPEVTLSFVPYADGLQGWIDQARAAGHETVLEAPMEPVDYPNNDPGPMTLMAKATPADLARRMETLLSRATGYMALTNYLGGRFLQSDSAMQAFTGVLRARGLGFIDDGQAARRGGGVPRASADTVIDQDLSAEGIDRQLAALEAAALARGGALGAGFAYPVTVDAIVKWAAGLPNRGYQLAPASAMMRR